MRKNKSISPKIDSKEKFIRWNPDAHGPTPTRFSAKVKEFGWKDVVVGKNTQKRIALLVNIRPNGLLNKIANNVWVEYDEYMGDIPTNTTIEFSSRNLLNNDGVKNINDIKRRDPINASR